MERNKIIAVVCAVVAFVLVLIAGKSCTDDALKAKKNSSSKTTAASDEQQPSIIYYPTADAPQTEPSTYETDILGRAVIPTTTAVQLDLFGRPITTETETEADIADDTETTPVTEPDTDENGNIVPTTTAPPRISGYDHRQYDEDGNPIPTLPSDFVLIIE